MAPKLGHLLDNWENAKDLLHRGPEALGKVLLEYLLDNVDDSQRIELDSFISWNSMFGRVMVGDIDTTDLVRDRRSRYPVDKDKEVLCALMEGWQWLILEGLVAPTPNMRESGDRVPKYFVTRRGIKMKKNLADLQE